MTGHDQLGPPGTGSPLPPSKLHSAQPLSNLRAGPTGRRLGAGWWFLNSVWLIIPIVGFGCLSGLPMIVIGLLVRRRAWWISGVVYTILAWAAFVGFGIASEKDRDSALSSILIVPIILIWLACIIHSVIVNVHWLQSRAAQTWPAPTGRPPNTPQPSISTSSVLPPGLVQPQDVYYGPTVSSPASPFASVPSASPAPAGTAVWPAHTGAVRLELNTATVDELAQLPGMNRRTAQRVIEARESRGGFRALTELAELGELDPHEFARIREHLSCTPRPQPGLSPPPYGGRIVDV